jgi:hypothetical protein
MVRILRKDYRNSQGHHQGSRDGWRDGGIGKGTEEKIVAATTEDGECDGALNQQQ